MAIAIYKVRKNNKKHTLIATMPDIATAEAFVLANGFVISTISGMQYLFKNGVNLGEYRPIDLRISGLVFDSIVGDGFRYHVEDVADLGATYSELY